MQAKGHGQLTLDKDAYLLVVTRRSAGHTLLVCAHFIIADSANELRCSMFC